MARNLASLPKDVTEDVAKEFIAERPFTGLPGFWVMIERDGRVIGSAGIGGAPLSLGYYLEVAQRGQGVMTEALGAFLAEVFARFPARRIVADHFVDNPASGSVLKKLGFVETDRGMGTSRARVEPAPVINYALLRENLKVPA